MARRGEARQGFRFIYTAQGGDTVKATWAVKDHNEFNGRKETIVNRPRKETLVSKGS